MLYKLLLSLPVLAYAQPAGPAPGAAQPTSVAPGTECTSCANGAVLKDMCYADLTAAISKSVTQDSIKVVGTNYVKAPISFGHDLSLIGVTCGDKRCVKTVDTQVQNDRTVVDIPAYRKKLASCCL